MASAHGQIIDALEVLWRSVVTELRPGEQGFLRGRVNVEDWGAAKLPYLMAHSPSKEETPLESHWQVEATYSVAFELWDFATQEEMLQVYDDFRAALVADKTLGGLVRFAMTSQQGLYEAVGKKVKALAVVVSCERVET